ncbi:MAG TPA: hypothetical protein VH081_06995 [Solirubrobacteraceae bacterium]|nr:hypothetical protein [Solirubrobacteraceae bacterium]
MATERYSARGKSVDEILKDYEDHAMDSTHSGNTTEYLQAALAVATARAQEAAAQAQERWAKVAASAAVASTIVAVAAVLVALLKG